MTRSSQINPVIEQNIRTLSAPASRSGYLVVKRWPHIRKARVRPNNSFKWKPLRGST
jgi:hypothetical protein